MPRNLADDINRVIDDLETKFRIEMEITKNYLSFGHFIPAISHIHTAAGYLYAAGELKKLL
ncbi:hypothetical protein [Paenibacillus tyrfis]|uniref:hypothetical protein n=1 Tax=Paenibacillus tyrfis TaxID=1501230 RepID=UPI0020A0C159|nr:hypothetical protein [Paenibacillus tyrfis]MCP1306432.1 hypothetical protein [Paenibacillus tyrfis]